MVKKLKFSDEHNVDIKPQIGFIQQPTLGSILDNLRFAAENKFDYFEIGERKGIFNLKYSEIQQIKKLSERHNISLFWHVPWFLTISTIVPEISQALIKFVKKEIILASKINAQKITIHSGYKEMPKVVLAKNFEVLINNLKEIVKIGREHRIEIGLENSSSGSHSMCVKPEELLNVINSIDGLKIVLDVGHANTTDSGPIQYLKKFRDKIINIHIHDNNGKEDEHLLMGEGNIDFKKFLKECKKSKYYGPFILELFPHKNVLKGREIFLDICNQI